MQHQDDNNNNNNNTEYAQADNMDVGWERNLHEANEV